MKVLVTGLPCNRKSEYLRDVRKLAKLNKKDVKVYSVGDLISEAAEEANININPVNILNMPTDHLTALVQNAYLKIKNDIGNHEHAIINTHALFYWKNIWKDSNNSLFLHEINPDLYITVIDSAKEIQKNMLKNKQWKTQKLTLMNLLDWQNLETLITGNYWAGINKKRYMAIPRRQPPETLYKLMFHPEIEIVYASFPMTNLGHPEESNKKIDSFIERLREYFVVIDPRSIELEFGAGKAENNQTVHRDLDLFVGKTDMTVCYYPEIVHSSGAINETVRAHDTTKSTYHIINLDVRSPFTDYNADVIKTPDDFFRMLEKEGYKKIKVAV